MWFSVLLCRLNWAHSCGNMAIIAINLVRAAAACRVQVFALVGECVRLHTSTTLTGSANNLFCSEYIRLYMYVNMYVCMCIYGHVYIYISGWVSLYACAYVWILCIFIYTRVCICEYYSYMCTSVHVCILSCMCLCACFGVLYRMGRRHHHLPQERNNDREERERQRKECIKIFLGCDGLENSVLNLIFQNEIVYGNCR